MEFAKITHPKGIFAAIIIVGLGLITAFNLGFFGSHQILVKTSFDQLPEWQTQDQGSALYAFQQSCGEIVKEKNRNKKEFSQLALSGSLSDWQDICKAAIQITRFDKDSAKSFFETWFQPYLVKNNFNAKGLFTGYYLPLIHASLVRTPQYTVPIYGEPSDLVKIDLGDFQADLSGKTVVARLQDHELTPYPDRAAIANGALSDEAPVIAWGNNPVDVYFAQIQGSAQLQTPDNKLYLLSYAGDNGRPYTAIGKVLLKKHLMEKENISMQSIRSWLEQNSDQAETMMENDASYVFFSLASLDAPVGAEKIPLTPERTLAVDTHFIPLGTPVWLMTKVPRKGSDALQPFNQLMIAQDSGGAIQGIVRGDVYWGPGEDAAYTAGHMNSVGQYWILLPKVKS